MAPINIAFRGTEISRGVKEGHQSVEELKRALISIRVKEGHNQYSS